MNLNIARELDKKVVPFAEIVFLAIYASISTTKLLTSFGLKLNKNYEDVLIRARRQKIK